MTYRDQTAYMILKFVGVFPIGLNRIHDAIEVLNNTEPFKSSVKSGGGGSIELLHSKFSQGSYKVEILVPYEVHTGEYGSTTKVTIKPVLALLNAVDEFRKA